MGAYRLGRLHLNNFRSFVDEVVDFSLTGMSLIRGFNLDTGGSSYAGKSSIPVGVALALGFCPFSVKDQQTWGTKSGLSVSQEIITDDGTWLLTRGSKTSLKPPKGATITGASAVDAALEKLVGVKPEVLAALTYRQQGDRGLFLTKTDAEKKEFLTLVLGLQAIEAAVEAAARQALVHDAEVAAHQAYITKLESELRSISDAPPSVADIGGMKLLAENLEKDLAAGQADAGRLEAAALAKRNDLKEKVDALRLKWTPLVEAAKAANESLKKELQSFQKSYVADVSKLDAINTSMNEAVTRLSKLTEADRVRQRAYQDARQSLESTISALRVKVSARRGLSAELIDLRAKVDAADANLCSTCGQAWKENVARKAVWVSRLENVVAELAQVQEAEAELAAKLEVQAVQEPFVIDPKIERFQSIVNTLVADRAQEEARLAQVWKLASMELEVKLAEDSARVSKLMADENAECDQVRTAADVEIRRNEEAARLLRSAISAYQERVYTARLQLKSAITENEVREAEFSARLGRRSELKTVLEEEGGALVKAKADADAERDFEEMIGYRGFLGVIFDEILAEITDETNKILAGVANTAHVTIHFSSEAVSQKGVARKEIRPVITIGGFPAPFESGASGGMKTSIALAVDLAVASVVSKRTNSWPGWMVLDESFEGLDAISKETCLEMLARHAGDRLILVVDHAAETKELFSAFIDVEFKNGRSTIRKAR